MNITSIKSCLLFLVLVTILFNTCREKPNPMVYDNIFDLTGDFDDNPPFANFNISPPTGTVYETNFKFDASLSFEVEAPDAILYYKWDFDGDDNWDTELTSEKTVTHRYYKSDRQMKVNLWVQGGNQLHSIKTKYIYVNSYPIPKIDWQFNLMDPDLILFDASLSEDENRNALLFRWDLNNDGKWDDDWSLTDTISYRYTNSDQWNIKLQVKDELGLIDTVTFRKPILKIADIIAYYPFTYNSYDSGPFNLHGQVNGSSLTIDRFAKINCAYYFDGYDDFISIDKIEKLETDVEFTISFWVKAEKYNQFILKYCFYQNGKTYNGHFFCTSNGVVLFKTHKKYRTYCGSIKINKWYHIAGVMDNSNYPDIYINGSKGYFWESGTDPNSVTYDSEYFNIGRVAGNYFQGAIDDLVIVNYALSKNKIETLYHMR